MQVRYMVAVFTLLWMNQCWAVDSDPEQDICVADLSSGISVNGYICKESPWITSQDFMFHGFQKAGNTSKAGFSGTMATVRQFPALNTQGLAMVRADFAPGGVNVPHIHPRASELVFVLEGTLYAGFVNSDNEVYAETLQKGDMFLIPRGLLHFQMNVGQTQASVLGTFNSQNPGLLRLPASLFTTNIKDDLLLKAFQLSHTELRSLRTKLKPAN